MKFSIIIPNWNGRKLLEKNLPKVVKAARGTEVIVVDDASPDDSNQFLEKNYPGIKIVKHPKNLGFAAACNSGVRAAQGEIIVLLNLDVVPEQDILDKILPDFKDEKVFAVSFHEPNWSWAKLKWVNGFVEHEPGKKTNETHVSGWASGGSAAFRKSYWKKLRGFDEIYKPFYWEDIDLSYRAWKRGWKVLWEPRAVVYHKHEAIIGKHYSKNYINFISERNRLLFIWKNIIDSKMIFEHKINVGKKLFKNPSYFKVLAAALTKLPLIIPRRLGELRKRKVSDREIFEKFS